ncbi:MAG: extracellular solute-binding protein, partial [Oscillospiraceae bacterium]|nr:extracellular solute-binding protein [Oscillospiraceae bacterium]
MIRKRAEAVLVTGALLVGMLSGCSKPASGSASGSASQKAAGGSVTVKFWSAPQKVQYNFWVSKAKVFNATNPKINGKNVTVKVQEMPESPSSEAGIQNAIVTGTIPAASENISRSFAATLANSNAIYNIENDKWYQMAVAEKKAGDTMKEWAIGSKQYVLPEYVNPMTWQWNSKALKALGFSKVPETMDDLKAVLKAFAANKAKMQALGVTHTLYRPALLRSDQWWERWYDFQGIYMALS